MAFPNVANYIRRYTTTTEIKDKTQGHGVGYVNGKLYLNTGAGAALFNDVNTDTAVNLGTVASVTGLVGVEAGNAWIHKTTFTLTAVPVTLLDASNGAGTKIYDFPKGATIILSAAGVVAETTTSTLASTLNTGITYNWGVGTTTQANGTLATTEQDIIPTTNGTASATINVAGAASKGTRTAVPAVFDGHATAKSAFFNVGIATATDIDGDATTTWTGTIEILWSILVSSV